jgi:RNA polymerase sigma-70 factor (ECF subfamily)
MMPCQLLVADSTLVLRLRAGDATAFRLLFDRYHAKLLSFSTRIVRSEATAEEIVQDVFVKVWEGRHGLDPDLSFQAYIYRIAKNRLLNHLRRQACERTLKKDWLHLALSQRNCNENQLVEADYEQVLSRAIAQLPPQRQRIYRMSREEELTYEEIAGSLGLSRHTVKAQMVQALDFVRRYVQVRTGIPLGTPS